mmetsp:Transcript_29759/g.30183  ORF Transcript_29759/g.30183 Transcript_29759/m.30183 type:complete len:82 (-) Transcript_29759:158-403(-)
MKAWMNMLRAIQMELVSDSAATDSTSKIISTPAQPINIYGFLLIPHGRYESVHTAYMILKLHGSAIMEVALAQRLLLPPKP